MRDSKAITTGFMTMMKEVTMDQDIRVWIKVSEMLMFDY